MGAAFGLLTEDAPLEHNIIDFQMWREVVLVLLRPELITIVSPIFVSGFDVNCFLLRVVLIPK